LRGEPEEKGRNVGHRTGDPHAVGLKKAKTAAEDSQFLVSGTRSSSGESVTSKKKLFRCWRGGAIQCENSDTGKGPLILRNGVPSLNSRILATGRPYEKRSYGEGKNLLMDHRNLSKRKCILPTT